MKRSLFVLLASVLALHVQAQQGVFYVNEFETQGPPLAIAADGDGNVYYTVFTFAGANQTASYYVEDPLQEVANPEHVLISDAAETDVPAGRGFSGIAVDEAGNVYLALESGSADTANVRKLSPAPDFAPVDDFGGGVVPGGSRMNGVDVIDADTLVLSTFSTIEIWDANDSAPLVEVTGAEPFQRDVAYNPNNGDIYVSRNGGESPESVNRVVPEEQGDIFTYTTFENGFIPNGAVATEFGSNGQLIEYDPVNDWIIIPDFSEDQSRVAFYQSDSPSQAAFFIDGSESPNGPFGTPSDIAAYTSASTGETTFYITDNPNNRILIYSTEDTSVTDWRLF